MTKELTRKVLERVAKMNKRGDGSGEFLPIIRELLEVIELADETLEFYEGALRAERDAALDSMAMNARLLNETLEARDKLREELAEMRDKYNHEHTQHEGAKRLYLATVQELAQAKAEAIGCLPLIESLQAELDSYKR